MTLLVGCGDPNELKLAPVSGTVKYQGQLLTRGQVVFFPANGTPGPQAVGQIQADGTFQMRTLERPGAAIGTHTVLIHSRAQLTPEQERNLETGKSLIPEKYGQLDGASRTFDVKPGNNTLPIELD